MPSVERTDFLVVGSGIAGLATALKAARYGRVTMITKGTLMDSNTRYAQGGIAAALGPGDTPQAHLKDTLRAGHDLCLPDAATVLVEDGPLRVKELIDLGANFDAEPGGALSLGREGAHSKNRIVHARGDATGFEVAQVLAAGVRSTERVVIHEHMAALELFVEKGRCQGLVAQNTLSGETVFFSARAVVLATGGLGRIYRYTTNPSVATGDGFALAARVGAQLVDMEFVQFHPTALDQDDDPMVLISEAVRGEGARLVNDQGQAFMPSVHPQADLAPRDIVARAIFSQMASGRRVFLDAQSIGRRFPDRFPTIYEACIQRGIDPVTTPIPIAPAAHFVMGGVRTDTSGRTNVPGLYACGEVACTGVHGANRLASNSLLEGLVFAERIASALNSELSGEFRHPFSPDFTYEHIQSRSQPDLSLGNVDFEEETSVAKHRKAAVRQIDDLTWRLRNVMWEYVGIVRDGDGLKKALEIIDEIEAQRPREGGYQSFTLRNMIDTSRRIAQAALMREESRGGHFRKDFPSASPDWRGRHIIL